MRQQFFDQQYFCVMCKNPIPPERVRYKSITCSDGCKTARKRSMYVKMSHAQCMFCRKPASRAEQVIYKRFLSWAKKAPVQAFPQEYKRWCIDNATSIDDRGAGEGFTFEVAMKMLEESFDLEKARRKRGRTDEEDVPASSEVGSAESQGSEMRDHQESDSGEHDV